MIDIKRIGTRYGLVFGLGLTILGIVLRLADVSVESPLTIVFYSILPVAAWIAIRKLRDAGNGAGFKDELIVASYATVIASVIYGVSVLLYNALIDASLLAEVEQYIRQKAVDSGKTGVALETAYRQAEVLTQPVPFAIVIFFQLALVGLSSALTFATWNKFRRPATISVV